MIQKFGKCLTIVIPSSLAIVSLTFCMLGNFCFIQTLQNFNERIVISSRKRHTQDATNTKTPTVIMQHTYNHTQPLTHAYACTNFLIKLTDVEKLEKGTRQT